MTQAMDRMRRLCKQGGNESGKKEKIFRRVPRGQEHIAVAIRAHTSDPVRIVSRGQGCFAGRKDFELAGVKSNKNQKE